MASVGKQTIKIKATGFEDALKQLKKASKEFKKAERLIRKIKITTK